MDHQDGLRISDGMVHLGDPLIQMTMEVAEDAGLPLTADRARSITEPPYDPEIFDRLLERVILLDHRVAALEARTLSARWARFVVWCRSLWPRRWRS